VGSASSRPLRREGLGEPGRVSIHPCPTLAGWAHGSGAHSAVGGFLIPERPDLRHRAGGAGHLFSQGVFVESIERAFRASDIRAAVSVWENPIQGGERFWDRGGPGWRANVAVSMGSTCRGGAAAGGEGESRRVFLRTVRCLYGALEAFAVFSDLARAVAYSPGGCDDRRGCAFARLRAVGGGRALRLCPHCRRPAGCLAGTAPPDGGSASSGGWIRGRGKGEGSCGG
jgi:hypothetical protein